MPRTITGRSALSFAFGHRLPASLELRKIYQALSDADAEAHNLVRVIDESGEDYLYLRILPCLDLPQVWRRHCVVQRIAACLRVSGAALTGRWSDGMMLDVSRNLGAPAAQRPIVGRHRSRVPMSNNYVWFGLVFILLL